MPNHSSRAPDASRQADDTGRRPKVPTGVDPMVSVQRGEIKDSFLAGITAHDGGGILSSRFHRQPRVVPPVLKGEKGKKGGFQTFKHEFLLKANMLDVSGHFIGQKTRVVPVGDPLKQKEVLLRDSFSSEEIKEVYQAWNFIDGAPQSEAD